MPVSVSQLTEEVEQMESFAEILTRMIDHQRCSISDSCSRLFEYSKSHQDPLLSGSLANPYLKKAGGSKKTCGCF